MRSELVVGDPWRFAGTTLIVEHDVDLGAEEAHGHIIEERPHPECELFDGVTISFSPRYTGDSLAAMTRGEMVMVNATVRDDAGLEKHFHGSATPVAQPPASA